MDGWRRRGTRRSFCSLPGALHAELHNVAYLLRIFVPSSHLLMVLAAPTIKQATNQPTSSSGVEWLLELLPLLVLRRLALLLLLLTDLIYHFRSPQNKIIHRRSISHYQTVDRSPTPPLPPAALPLCHIAQVMRVIYFCTPQKPGDSLKNKLTNSWLVGRFPRAAAAASNCKSLSRHLPSVRWCLLYVARTLVD